jgi:hypothetical protein
VLAEVGGHRPAGADDERRLVEEEPGDAIVECGGGVQGEYAAAGAAGQRGRLAERVEQGGDVLDLAGRSVGLGVAALAPATPVVVDDRAPVREEAGDGIEAVAVVQGRPDARRRWWCRRQR